LSSLVIEFFLVLAILSAIISIVLNIKVSLLSKDEFLINLAVLDHVIDDYVAIIFSTKLKSLGLLYNLDPESKLNAIKSYEKKINETVAQSTKEVIDLLSKKTKTNLQQRFSDKSIALYITNKLKTSI
jgi:hypothetical protein